ncbi:hypothetical protein ASG01_10540 [Chryseobacterium sp. Leaf180]|uniref:TlpA family protein disulfide reductase n=1 Tax=Chryseobacterium sp. Leaf180 TaxID=1736289 RepID=UPI0006F51EB9|nr:TlpA disulfide reductase family protein [Chryseobacterium sp. Leaf180]KQR93597.1 hypothetical protein ASG01_10540 [Chryseobacterium sp. Leaf180]
MNKSNLIKNFPLIILMLSFGLFKSQNSEALFNFPGYDDMIGKTFSVEQFSSTNDENFSFENLSGKPTVINFWSTICEPCIEEMPHLNNLYQELKDSAHFIGITFSTKENVEKFLLKHNFLLDLITNADYKLIEQNRITRFPMTIILDKDQKIAYVLGKVNAENVELIKKELKK